MFNIEKRIQELEDWVLMKEIKEKKEFLEKKYHIKIEQGITSDPYNEVYYVKYKNDEIHMFWSCDNTYLKDYLKNKLEDKIIRKLYWLEREKNDKKEERLYGKDLQDKLNNMEDYKERFKLMLEYCKDNSNDKIIGSVTKETAIKILKDLGEEQ